MALILTEPEDELLEAAFETLRQVLKTQTNVQFLKDKGFLRQLLEVGQKRLAHV